MSKTTAEKFKMIPTDAMGIYANQIVAYIQDIGRTLQKLEQIRKMPDIIFDSETRGQDLWAKSQEAAKLYNQIMIEMERRCKKDLGFSFDYPQISKITEQVDKAFAENIGGTEGTKEQKQAAADRQVARGMPESLLKKT